MREREPSGRTSRDLDDEVAHYQRGLELRAKGKLVPRDKEPLKSLLDVVAKANIYDFIDKNGVMVGSALKGKDSAETQED